MMAPVPLAPVPLASLPPRSSGCVEHGGGLSLCFWEGLGPSFLLERRPPEWL